MNLPRTPQNEWISVQRVRSFGHVSRPNIGIKRLPEKILKSTPCLVEKILNARRILAARADVTALDALKECVTHTRMRTPTPSGFDDSKSTSPLRIVDPNGPLRQIEIRKLVVLSELSNLLFQKDTTRLPALLKEKHCTDNIAWFAEFRTMSGNLIRPAARLAFLSSLKGRRFLHWSFAIVAQNCFIWLIWLCECYWESVWKHIYFCLFSEKRLKFFGPMIVAKQNINQRKLWFYKDRRSTGTCRSKIRRFGVRLPPKRTGSSIHKIPNTFRYF